MTLHAKAGEPIPGYHDLSVHGRCGSLDSSKSVQVSKQFPARVSTVWKGLYFDPASWDGSDLFIPEGKGGWIFVSEPVKRALEKAKVKNVVFAPLAGVERDNLQAQLGAGAFMSPGCSAEVRRPGQAHSHLAGARADRLFRGALLEGQLSEVAPRVAAHMAGADLGCPGVEAQPAWRRVLGIEEVVPEDLTSPDLLPRGVVAPEGAFRALLAQV